MVSTFKLVLPLAVWLVSHTLVAQDSSQVVALGSKTSQSPAVAEVPSPPMTPERRADILMARKMYREAIELYQQAPQNSAVICNKIGIAYHQMMQLEAARRRYQKAIHLDPRYPEAINNLGTIYYTEKHYSRAVRYYKRALKLTPDSASILSNLGTGYFAQHKYKDAAAAYDRALRLDPEVFEHRSTYGVLLQERSVEERAKYHYYLAKTYAKAGQTERALLCIRKALEEGFTERKKLLQDQDFAALRDLPEFKQLLTLEPRVL
jgi:tetratricopeptide (TPR) repeat protein